MSDDNRINDDDKNRKSGEFRVPPKTWIVWILIIGGILGLVLFRNQMTVPPESIKPSEFMAKLEANQIESATINYSPQSPLQEITGKYKVIDNKSGEPKTIGSAQFRVKLPLTDKTIEKLIAYPNVEVKEPNTMLLSVM